jgi:hypothetical protein
VGEWCRDLSLSAVDLSLSLSVYLFDYKSAHYPEPTNRKLNHFFFLSLRATNADTLGREKIDLFVPVASTLLAQGKTVPSSGFGPLCINASNSKAQSNQGTAEGVDSFAKSEMNKEKEKEKEKEKGKKDIEGGNTRKIRGGPQLRLSVALVRDDDWPVSLNAPGLSFRRDARHAVYFPPENYHSDLLLPAAWLGMLTTKGSNSASAAGTGTEGVGLMAGRESNQKAHKKYSGSQADDRQSHYRYAERRRMAFHKVQDLKSLLNAHISLIALLRMCFHHSLLIATVVPSPATDSIGLNTLHFTSLHFT